jgi:hypothetical protein
MGSETTHRKSTSAKRNLLTIYPGRPNCYRKAEALSLGMRRGSTITFPKANATVWKHPTSPVRKMFKTQPSARNVKLTFWVGGAQGPILEHY